jgi:hypothetical protein
VQKQQHIIETLRTQVEELVAQLANNNRWQSTEPPR